MIPINLVLCPIDVWSLIIKVKETSLPYIRLENIDFENPVGPYATKRHTKTDLGWSGRGLTMKNSGSTDPASSERKTIARSKEMEEY
jgi:hypothetical protein